MKYEYRKLNSVKNFLDLSRLHLHSACAIMTGGYDYRGSVQAALLSTKLALKAGLLAHGVSEDDLKQYGHNLLRLSTELSIIYPNIDAERMRKSIDILPNYVNNRYSIEQRTRIQLGNRVMSVQFLVSEIVRQLSERNFRLNSNREIKRAFP